MSNKNDTFRVRAATFEIKKPTGIAGYVLKIKGDALDDLIKEMSGRGYSENGATLFLNVFENDSEYNEGEKYLSSTITPVVTEDRSNGGEDSGKRQLSNKIGKSYGDKVKSRR